ncbi:hypothetical protein [Croceicoccus marinus]|uniref:Uncharacterized protein n=1 Tax=Croceicoccus marinus TaxID=450378 RepID=A0A7G6VUR6_9SPHN|nr:hypothetical protein [Croceicoccus marinus]QNE05481.1 hypothetical protein H4O24_01910 [Croceicoccus marinus]
MRITPVLTGAAVTGALLLASCNAEPERSADDTRDAGGEVLQGTISDEMIQFDQLRSQGVPAEVEAGDGAEDGAQDGTGDGTGDGTADGGSDDAAPASDPEAAEEPADAG